MTRLLASVLALIFCAAASHAQQLGDCTVPNYMLFGDSTLERVNAAAVKTKAIKIVVVGSTSSTLPGRDGSANAYPARLEAWLQKRLPGLSITVTTHAKPRQTAHQMAEFLEKVTLDEKPNLVIWQTGTFDALRGVDPEDFRASVAAGVETLHGAGSDVIIMNMQYSPRTELMIPLGVYADNMRWVAREFEVPLFDRLAIMRHWFDSGAIDLYGATKDTSVAKRVHDCVARALAAMIVEAARLEAFEGKAAQ
jgi:hypothetical protein